MCGRYQLTSDPRLTRLLRPSSRTYEGPFTARRLWNIHPGMRVPTFFKEGDRVWLEPFLWGWTTHSGARTKRFPNLRSETAGSRGDLHERRCLIPATGFYEWLRKEDGQKQPYLIRLRETRGMFFMAGLWAPWESPRGVTRTMAILTSEPNGLIAKIHSRQPVILDEQAGLKWLDRFDPALFEPIHRGKLEATPVSSVINNPKNNDERAVVPIAPEGPPLW